MITRFPNPGKVKLFDCDLWFCLKYQNRYIKMLLQVTIWLFSFRMMIMKSILTTSGAMFEDILSIFSALISSFSIWNWHDLQIPQCISTMSHNVPWRTEMFAFLFWIVHCGIWNRYIMGFMRLVHWICILNKKHDKILSETLPGVAMQFVVEKFPQVPDLAPGNLVTKWSSADKNLYSASCN